MEATRHDLQSRIRRDVEPLLAQRGSARIVVWGAGELGSWLMDELGDRGVAFVDKNPLKHGARIAARAVHPPEALGTLEFDEVWITVLSDVDSVRTELESMGLVEGRTFRAPFEHGKLEQVLQGWPRLSRYLSHVDLSDSEVLEVGCGGQLFFAAALLWRGASTVTVTDVTCQRGVVERRRRVLLEFMAEIAKVGPPRIGDGSPEALLERIVVRTGPMSASDLAFASGTFDVVASTGVMEHVDDPDAAIGEFARVLRPGGVTLAAAIGIHDHRANDPRSGFTPWSFLRHDTAAWGAFEGNAYHQNRWRAVDFRRSFARHGFEILHDETEHDARLAADEVADFAPEFRERYSLAELAELDQYVIARRL